MERNVERLLFASRWLMAPMYLGLAGSLLILVWVFLSELGHLVLALPNLTVNDAILSALALIDLSLAANLLLIVILSGYENFISRMDLLDHKDRPDWLGEVDFSGLKLKLVASIVAISSIHLLKVFMDVGSYPPEKIRWMVIIHLVFLLSGVLLALMDWITQHGKTLKKVKPARD
ncbi:TIGR00645 family protein [Paracoccus aminophilus]|uniref:UPF0114 protein JCM7686_0382 n=1 Tax=Paracoccus aminophilus JCM 7686 TaxID=1367847 RepID=S5YQE6_PARAH|nr:TIGR00645 family protein [Paracoccus aminophilus]AGT07491.1 hypothetical protein JCM7686_0382 [Paracoccus aminophilus JCM 7686]